MDVTKIEFPEPEARLKTLLKLPVSNSRGHEVGSGFLPKGSRMPENGTSTHPRREVSIILEGKLRTMSGGKTVILRAGDIVTIPAGQAQCSEVLEDTRLIYLFLDS